MSHLLLIPALNSRIKLLKGPFFGISDNIVIQKLTDEEHSAFFRHEETDVRSFLKINVTKCVKVDYQQEPTEEIIKVDCLKIQFLLNIFSDNSPLIFQWAALIEGHAKLEIKGIHEFDSIASLHDFCLKEYKIREATTRQGIIEFYKVITDAISKDPNAKFTFRKFNSSLIRLDFYDQLIDTTICLESMIKSTTELSFKFSLFLSFITKDLPAERDECFKKLKDLYDVRSKIVHGEIDNGILKKIETIKLNWEYYHNLLRSALIYYSLYLSKHTSIEWKKHMLSLVLGTENKVIL